MIYRLAMTTITEKSGVNKYSVELTGVHLTYICTLQSGIAIDIYTLFRSRAGSASNISHFVQATSCGVVMTYRNPYVGPFPHDPLRPRCPK